MDQPGTAVSADTFAAVTPLDPGRDPAGGCSGTEGADQDMVQRNPRPGRDRGGVRTDRLVVHQGGAVDEQVITGRVGDVHGQQIAAGRGIRVTAGDGQLTAGARLDGAGADGAVAPGDPRAVRRELGIAAPETSHCDPCQRDVFYDLNR